ncbi:MAG: class I SAM-dependent methyltransferase [Rhizobiaceae bacterium]|nr:class I SAM-dependent methyltransferase [Rhizobiaceae bacterium]
MLDVAEFALDGESLITPESFLREFAHPKPLNADAQFEEASAHLALVLNFAHQQFVAEAVPATIIERVARELHKIRMKYSANVWQALISVAQSHPVAEYFLQDPFTNWSFTKPRGYSGDAGLLDFIYGHPSIEPKIESATQLGKDLFEYTRNASSSVAVRERRDILAQHVDEIAAQRGPGTEVLAIAAGHLREAKQSKALQKKGLKRWVALDQDPQSIASIQNEYAGTVVEPVDGSVRSLLGNTSRMGQFDFVYAAGLYDYLTQNVAIKLTRRCLNLLKPDGVFLFANFAQGIGVDGYMETFMNWPLLLRSEKQIWTIIEGSVDNSVTDANVFFGANHNIVYGVISKG